jgi:hypothetical protein
VGRFAPSFLSGVYTAPARIAVSNNGLYSVEYQGDGNLVVYKLNTAFGTISKALWATNKYNMNISRVTFDSGGDIYVQRHEWINGSFTMLWASGTGGHNFSGNTTGMWIIQDDGNFVGYPVNTGATLYM